MQKLIYTDRCNSQVAEKIQSELNLRVIERVKDSEWAIQKVAGVLTDPSIVLAVFNNLDEISLLEIGLLLFLCRPILITDSAAKEYTTLIRQVEFVEPSCNLKDQQSLFVSWYKYTRRENG